ncbi:hypothetical protein OG753_04155 [Streptomyces sp. NBC_00029]|uniref:hypothetical protein n=1 Tax=Streptomyces sp. NBC_00029 TaxID=2903613 RepID=UPI00324AE6B3
MATFHSRTVLSVLPVARVLPSGLNARDRTLSVWPVSGARAVRAATSHSHTVFSLPALQEQQARILAQALLNGPIELTVAERTELQAVANGEAATAGKWDAIKKLFLKIPGSARAVKGSHDDFAKVAQGPRLEVEGSAGPRRDRQRPVHPLAYVPVRR